MVRHYKPKNRYEKWSKLTTEQMAYIFRIYFVPSFKLENIAKNAALSRRTVATKLARINEFILSDHDCRAALIAHLQPEMDGIDWLSRNEDLTEDSDLWGGLHTCYFACPAMIEPALHIQQISRFKGLRYIEELETRKGHVSMVKVRCAACPVQPLRDNVPLQLLLSPKTYMVHHKRTSRRTFRPFYFRYLFYSALTMRAGKAEATVSEAERDKVYRATMDRNGRDLAIILAHHMTMKTQSA